MINNWINQTNSESKIYDLVYLEVGGAASDTASVTITYGDTSTAKNFLILVRQIECDNTNRSSFLKLV